MNTYPENNAEIVFTYCKSPIERIFINSLQLLFLKNGLMGLHLTPPFKDSTLEISNYRTAHKNIMSLTSQYVEMTGDKEMNAFKDFFYKRIEAGQYTEEDYQVFEYHRLLVENFIWNFYHLTPQAKIKEIIVNKKPITVDLLLWCPGDENLKIVVECDGFHYHNSKESFENDRKRDRLLQLNGYKVIGFSGKEIFNDPVEVSSELYNLLLSLENQKKSKPNIV